MRKKDLIPHNFLSHNLHYEKFQDGTVKCIEDEIPFELPEGWEWARLKDLLNVCSSKRVLQSDWKNEGIPFYRAREIVKLSENDFIDNELFISEEHYLELKKNYGVPQSGDLMVSSVGTIGKVYIVKPEDLFYYKDASVLCFENKNKLLVSQFAKILLESSFVQSQMRDNSKGTTVDTITISAATNYLCIVPPKNEQLRIVNAAQRALVKVIQIQSNKDVLQATITNAKSKILDLAIRGKLVPQDPNDEPASVLLERIREEKEELIKQGKIKRDKMESVIFKGDDNSYYEKIGDSVACIDAELPFEIPDNWCWARLNCISINYDSYRKPINSYDRKNRVLGKSKDELYPYYGATGQIGFIDDFLFNGEYILLGEDAAPFLDKKAQKAYMIKGKSWVNNHAHILQSLVFPEYLTNCLNSIDYFDYVYGTTRLKLTQENMNRILVPVPSIEEQCKIAQAINNLFVLIESIKASLS